MNPVLNIASFEVPDIIVTAGIFPYDPEIGHDDLADLRRKHRRTHAVARRADLTVCLPRIQNAPPVGEAQEALPLRQNLSLVRRRTKWVLIE